MSEKHTILDYEEDRPNNPENHLASTGMRLANYLLDTLGFYAMFYGIGTMADTLPYAMHGAGIIFLFLMIPGYWVLSEYFWGKSPAKFITKTKVVTKYGQRPGFWNIVGRTFCRFIPFEPFSFLGSRPVGWHDSISGTFVVVDNFGEKESDFV